MHTQPGALSRKQKLEVLQVLMALGLPPHLGLPAAPAAAAAQQAPGTPGAVPTTPGPAAPAAEGTDAGAGAAAMETDGPAAGAGAAAAAPAGPQKAKPSPEEAAAAEMAIVQESLLLPAHVQDSVGPVGLPPHAVWADAADAGEVWEIMREHSVSLHPKNDEALRKCVIELLADANELLSGGLL